MKRLFITLALIVVNQIAFCQTRVSHIIVNENWMKFESISDRIEALQIRPDIISSVSTEVLLEECLNFPYLIDFYLYGENQQAFELFVKEFNGLKELLGRNDLSEVLLAQFKRFPHDFEKVKKEDEIKKGKFSLQSLLLEYILIQDSVINRISPDLLNSILLDCFTNYRKIIQRNLDIFGSSHNVPISIALSKSENFEKNPIRSSNPYTSTIIYTPNGTAVPALLLTGNDHTSANIAYIMHEMATYYSQAEIIEGPTKKYNCHAYAWHVSEGGNQVWLNRPDESLYWSDGSYIEVPEELGVKVSYFGDHSAVRLNSSTYISKWGSYPLVKHAPNYVPYGYMNPNKFYIRIPQLSGSSILSNVAQFHIEYFPIGCTVNWTVSNNCVQITSGQGTETVTLQRNYDGWVTLTATISYNGTIIKTLNKEIMVVGTPDFCMGIYPVSADGEWGYWRSDLSGNTIEVDFIDASAYSNYIVDLYRLNNDFSLGTRVGHWTTSSLDNMTFGYYPQGWYSLEVVGVNDCGTSNPVGTEIECVDGSWGMPRMFSFTYSQDSQMLTVTLNPVLTSSRKQSSDGCEIQLWNENSMLRKFRMTDGKLQIPMSGMKSGLYIVRAITDDGKSQQHKLMKK